MRNVNDIAVLFYSSALNVHKGHLVIELYNRLFLSACPKFDPAYKCG